MLRVCVTFVVLAFVAVLMMGSSFKETSIQPVVNIPPVKKHSCMGFTVIEASTGIDCHGDTVRLVKRGGIYELASTAAVREKLVGV